MKKLLVVLGVLLFARSASAQSEAATASTSETGGSIHFDTSVQAGIAKRFFSSTGGLSGSFGPVLLLEGDIALAPLLRLGAYLDEEWGLDGEPKSPFITSGGLRLKVTPPTLTTENFRFWVFVGVGFSGVVAPGYHQTAYLPNENQSGASVPTDITVASATGSFFEVPFGVGSGFRLHGPWFFVAELSGRADFANGGSYFDPNGRNAYQTNDPSNQQTAVIGAEAVGVFLTAGIGLDR